MSARIRPGSDATLIDVASGGALIETVHRLLPGAPIELQLLKGDCRSAVRGRVVRCSVSRLRTCGVWYRGAVAFDAPLPWEFGAEGVGYAVPGREPRREGREDATPHIR